MSALHVLNRNRNFVQHLTTFKKFYHKIQPLSDHVSEVEVKVPWGKISGKLWGSPEKQPIIALHGWQDNAGSFDAIAPLLLNHTSILAIDWPGHGWSSWLPGGDMYTEMTYIMAIHRVKRYFGWKQVKILAHSLGAQISFFYASLFPADTKFVIALDILKVGSVDMKMKQKFTTESINKFLEVEELTTPAPSHSREAVIERWIKATDGSINEEACKTLMIRGTKQHQDGTFSFSRDPRVKMGLYIMGGMHVQYQEMAQFINCPYMYLKGEQSLFPRDKQDEEDDIINIMKQNCSDFQYLMVPGTHHLHMTHPETAAAPIKSFLEKYNK